MCILYTHTTQNLWNIAKVDLRRKFIVMQVYLKKQKESQMNNLTSHLKEQEKKTRKKAQSEYGS